MGSGLSVCQAGQIGIATTFALNQDNAMMGALLTHTASEISVSNAVPSFFDTPPAQTAPCVGNYDSGASVSCDSSGTPVSAVDTQGNHWICHKNTRPVPGAEEEFQMYACCDRA